MKYLRLAILNLSRQKRRSFLLGGAIAFGIFVITLIGAFAGSLKRNVQINVTDLVAGHIFINRAEKSPSDAVVEFIHDDRPLLALLEELKVQYKSLHKRSHAEARLIFQGNTMYQELEGILLEEELEGLSKQLNMQEGSLEGLSQRNGIVISRQMQRELNVNLGEQITVSLQTVTGQYNVGDFKVVGIFNLPGIKGSLASSLANLDYMNELLNIPRDAYMTLSIQVKDIAEMDRTARIIYRGLEERFQVFPREKLDLNLEEEMKFAFSDQEYEEDWSGVRYLLTTLNDLLGFIDDLVALLNKISLGILVVLMVIILVGISNTYRMIMLERVREIGTMRALGMQRGGIRRLFLYEPMVLSLAGALAGVLVSLIIGFLISRYNFGEQSVISFFLRQGRLSFNLDLGQIGLAVLIVSGLTLVSTFIIAGKAARLKPAEALRSFA